MSNTLLNSSVLLKESLRILHNSLTFTKGVSREYSSEFAKDGAKVGNTINVRNPNRYAVQQGPSITPQGTTESKVPLTLNRQWVVPMSFSSTELTLDIDKFSDRYIVPAMAKLASTIDMDGLAMAITGKYADGNSATGAGPVFNVVGTPGTTPGTTGGTAVGLAQYNAPQVYLNAGMVLDNSACPRDGRRSVVLNPAAQAQSIGALTGLFNPQNIIAEQYKNGLMGNALGFDFLMDQNVRAMTCGTRVASASVVISSIGVEGDTSIVTKTGTGTVVAGDVFTIAGVYGVNPENQQSTGLLQQFVVTADKTLTGTADTVNIYPSLKVANGTTVADGTITALPQVNAAVTFVGVASTATPQNLAYHKDAFTLGTADMEVPKGCDFANAQSYDGISMRIVRDYDISSDLFICRIDVLGGWATLRPELAARIAG